MILKAQKHAVPGAMIFQAKGDVRYYLNGICFAPDKKLVSTDGHRMFISLVTGPGGKALTMSEPLTGAESARPETFAEKSRREALAAALSAIQALREGKAHPHVYRGAAGHQQKLQERKEAAQKLLAGRKTRAPVAQHNAHVRLWQQTLNLPPDYTSAYNFVPGGGRDNWRGD